MRGRRQHLLNRIEELELEVERLHAVMGDVYDEAHEHGVASTVQVLSDPKRCDRYLKSLHTTLWGQSFEVISPAGRAEAADWLAAQIIGVAGPIT